MPTFTGEKETYRNFMTIFEAWEDKEDVRRATTDSTQQDDLPTKQEYWDGSREVETVDLQGNVVVVDVPLTDEQKKIYLDNAKSKAKLCVHVSSKLLQPMLTASELKDSVYQMKQWFEENYAEVEVEESLQDLT